MDNNYLNNLIYTEYIHELQVLEDSFDKIPEVKETDIENVLFDKLVKKVDKKDSETQHKEIEQKDELIKLDDNEKISVDKHTFEKLALNKNITGKNLLEFDYIKQKEISENSFQENEKHSFNDWLKIVTEKNNMLSLKKDNNKNNTNGKLIDEFIGSNPKIIPVKNQDNEIKDFSKESVKETTEFFTETLATIYIKQKAYNKAIQAYEKLILKYPEKSIYFANQIKKIKEIINNH